MTTGERFLPTRSGRMVLARVAIGLLAVLGTGIAVAAWQDGSVAGTAGALAWSGVLVTLGVRQRGTGYVLSPGEVGVRSGLTGSVVAVHLEDVAVLSFTPARGSQMLHLWSVRPVGGPLWRWVHRLGARREPWPAGAPDPSSLTPVQVLVAYLGGDDQRALLEHLHAAGIPVRRWADLPVRGPAAG